MIFHSNQTTTTVAGYYAGNSVCLQTNASTDVYSGQFHKQHQRVCESAHKQHQSLRTKRDEMSNNTSLEQHQRVCDDRLD